MRIAWVFAVVGCARDNPFFDDGSTDGADASASITTTSPTSTAGSMTSQGPATTSPDDSTSVSTTDPVLTSDGDTSSTGGSFSESTFGTTACQSVAVPADLRQDAFVETDPKCDYCDDANYGATNAYSVHAEGDPQTYYLMAFDMLPTGSQVLAARVITNIERPVNDQAHELYFHAFFPGCDWQEGNGTGLSETPDGITFNDCDPTTKSGYAAGSLLESFGDALADPVVIDGKMGPIQIDVELHVDAVQSWLDAGGDSLVFSTNGGRGAIYKPAREHAAEGGVELIIDVCE